MPGSFVIDSSPLAAPGECFVQGMEVWVPDGERLRHHSGSYGPHAEFARVSALKTFRREEGLPGAVWSSERPQIWEELGSHFVRQEIAAVSGIEAAVGFPLFHGDVLSAVVVLLCGRRTRTGGCIEVWDTKPELGLLEHAGGYYGNLEQFGNLSRLLQFESGTGLPGLAWERGTPQIFPQHDRPNAFVRESIAREHGIQTGLAIPIFRGHDVAHVVVLLSSAATPIARAFEVWTASAGTLRRRAAHYGDGLEGFAGVNEELTFRAGEGLPGRAFAAKLPVVFDGLETPKFSRDRAAAEAGLSAGIGIPVLEHGEVTAVACLLS